MTESDQKPLTEYVEVCKSHNGITDFRAKLMALLPIASGAGIFSLLRDVTEARKATQGLIAFGLFGVVITVGLLLHEWRGMRRCWELVELGKSLEKDLGLEGQFSKEHSYYDSRYRLVGTGTASWTIYLTVLLAWLGIFALGLFFRLSER
jgi:hypothetical protein